MKKVAMAGLMLATMTGVAAAADLPSRAAPPVYAPPPLPVFTWTGAYFGVNAGYAFDYDPRFTTFNNGGSATGAGTTRPANVKLNADGFTGGGQIGYNYQFGGFGGGNSGGIVVGVEADAAYTDLDRTRSFTAPNGTTSLSTFRSQLDYLGTVRGRVGFAFNQFLIYGTGGLAYGGVENRANFFAANQTTLNYTGSSSNTRTGFAYGGGVEYALPTTSFLNFFHSSAVTVKAEYLHYDLGRSTLNVAATGNNGTTGGYLTRVKTEGDLARVGLNYKFGSY